MNQHHHIELVDIELVVGVGSHNALEHSALAVHVDYTLGDLASIPSLIELGKALGMLETFAKNYHKDSIFKREKNCSKKVVKNTFFIDFFLTSVDIASYIFWSYGERAADGAGLVITL